MNTYLVGGAVRDDLLGLTPTERDWVIVGGDPDALLQAGYRQVGRDFPVFLHPRTGEEYALARTERKSGPGYHGFAIDAGPHVTLEEDLARRDLTINAMARAEDGTLIDPCGGQRDLDDRLLRHVSPAFQEDPLRVLRVARFAARLAPLGFSVAPETRELMRAMAASGELAWLTPERVWQETERALGGADPARYFDELGACDALAAVFPELAAVWTTPDVPAALRCAARSTDDTAIRFAALCHRLDADDGLASLCERLPVPRRLGETARLTADWQARITDVMQADAESLLSILEGLDAPRRARRFEAVLQACEAIATAHGETIATQIERLQTAREAACAVNGARLANEGWRGAALGRELRRQRLEALVALVAGGGSAVASRRLPPEPALSPTPLPEGEGLGREPGGRRIPSPSGRGTWRGESRCDRMVVGSSTDDRGRCPHNIVKSREKITKPGTGRCTRVRGRFPAYIALRGSPLFGGTCS